MVSHRRRSNRGTPRRVAQLLAIALIVGGAVVVVGSPSSPAGSVSTGNLLANGGAEEGPISDAGLAPVPVPAWTTVGAPPVVLAYADDIEGYVSATAPGPPDGGRLYFAGGPGVGSLAQAVDLGQVAPAVDSGEASYALVGWLGAGRGAPAARPAETAVTEETTATTTTVADGPDRGGGTVMVELRFLDDANQLLGTATLGPVAESSAGGATGLARHAIGGGVPAGARAATVEVAFASTGTGVANAYADSLELVLELPTGPPTSTTVPDATTTVATTTSTTAAPSTTAVGPSTTASPPSTTAAAPSTTASPPSTTAAAPSTTASPPSTTAPPPSTTAVATTSTIPAASEADDTIDDVAAPEGDVGPAQDVPLDAVRVEVEVCVLGTTAGCDVDNDAHWSESAWVPEGRSARWRITVANNSTLTLQEMDLEGSLAEEGCRLPRRSLEVGGTLRFACTTEGVNVDTVHDASVAGHLADPEPEIDGDDAAVKTYQAAIEIDKFTNGADSDAAPGNPIFAGEPVTWSYKITNIGKTTLGDLVLIDSELFPDGKAISGQIAPGESRTHVERGSASVGLHHNESNISGQPLDDVTGAPIPNALRVSADDPSHHYGIVAGDIRIRKLTNGTFAPTPVGPHLKIGDTVTWRYEVTNPTPFPIADVAVTDNQLSDNPRFVRGDDNPANNRLDPPETWIYEATGTVRAGQYANIGTVVGKVANPDGTLPPDPPTVTDSSPSHYCGEPTPSGGATCPTPPPASTSSSTSSTSTTSTTSPPATTSPTPPPTAPPPPSPPATVVTTAVPTTPSRLPTLPSTGRDVGQRAVTGVMLILVGGVLLAATSGRRIRVARRSP